MSRQPGAIRALNTSCRSAGSFCLCFRAGRRNQIPTYAHSFAATIGRRPSDERRVVMQLMGDEKRIAASTQRPHHCYNCSSMTQAIP